MGRIGDKRTPEQIEAHLIAKRAIRTENANVLAFDLLDQGFVVWIDMQQITSHGDFYCYVVVDAVELGGERFDDVIVTAKAHGAHISLKEIRMNQQSFTRLCLWPVGSED
jgi:hypothetical protein